MAIEIVPLTEGDIPGTIECIQQAFADDPYFHWVFDSSKVCIGGPSGNGQWYAGGTPMASSVM